MSEFKQIEPLDNLADIITVNGQQYARFLEVLTPEEAPRGAAWLLSALGLPDVAEPQRRVKELEAERVSAGLETVPIPSPDDTSDLGRTYRAWRRAVVDGRAEKAQHAALLAVLEPAADTLRKMRSQWLPQALHDECDSRLSALETALREIKS